MISGPLQLAAESFVLAFQFGDANPVRTAEHGLASAPSGCQGVEDALVTLRAPFAEMGGVQALPTQDGADLPRLAHGVGRLQDPPLVFGGEPTAPRLRGDLGVRQGRVRVVGLYARPPGSLRGRRRGHTLRRIRSHHRFRSFSPSLIGDGEMVSPTLAQRAKAESARIGGPKANRVSDTPRNTQTFSSRVTKDNKLEPYYGGPGDADRRSYPSSPCGDRWEFPPRSAGQSSRWASDRHRGRRPRNSRHPPWASCCAQRSYPCCAMRGVATGVSRTPTGRSSRRWCRLPDPAFPHSG